MGIFEKFGLVEPSEKITKVNDYGVSSLNVTTTEEIVDIMSIYANAGLTDMEKSIFKVEELKNVLPTDLSNELKKKSILGIMPVSGVTSEMVKEDANNRLSVLQEALDIYTNETNNIISNNKEEISGLESQINDLNKQNDDRRKLQEEYSIKILEEAKRIESIVQFIS